MLSANAAWQMFVWFWSSFGKRCFFKGIANWQWKGFC
jgi:hypothetical protein